MANNLEFKCPLCGKPLGGEEYQATLKNLKSLTSQEYQEKLNEIRDHYDKDREHLNSAHKETLNQLSEGYKKQFSELETRLEENYKMQLGQFKKSYEKISSQNEKGYKKRISELQKDLRNEIKSKEDELKKLKKERVTLEEQIRKRVEKEERHKTEDLVYRLRQENQAQIQTLNQSLNTKDLIIERTKQQLEDLRKTQAQTSSEAKGELGERDLYRRLSEAFQKDLLQRSKRGERAGDIIQRIRLDSGAYAEQPIVYDNKEDTRVSRTDIEKAKSYKKIHNTDYVIIVSSTLPKEIPNGKFGYKDGIILAHPSLVIGIAKLVRDAIISINREGISKTDRDKKEARLFGYIKSPEFRRSIERLSEVENEMAKLQKGEEEGHQHLWNRRKEIQRKIQETQIEIEGKIASILQESPILMVAPIKKKKTKQTNEVDA